MDIKITTLTENSANNGFLAEWGLSMLVEVDGLKILMDTGRTMTAVHNAHVLGINLSSVDKIVVSHGHGDHTGGLSDVLSCTGEIEVIGHPDIWSSKYAMRNEKKTEFIGIPFNREELESKGARFTLSTKPVRINNRIMTTGEVPITTDYETMEDYLKVRINQKMIPEEMSDDLALIIDADFGLVVITGCAHRGIVNTLRHARNLTGKKDVYAVIGGTHLVHASEERILRTIADLEDIGVQRLGVSHCTGFNASSMLAMHFQDRFFLNNAGTSITLP